MRRSILIPFSTLVLLFMVAPGHAMTVTVPGDFPTVRAVVEAIHAHALIDTVLMSAHLEPSPLNIDDCALTVIGVPGPFGVLPTLPGMLILDGEFNFRGLHVLGPIEHYGNTVFRGCEIDSGVASQGAGNSPGNLHFIDCTLRGQPALSLIHYVSVDSCRVFGGINVNYPADAGLTMRHSTMTGPGSVAITLGTSNGCHIEGNVIRGFDNGFSAAIEDGQLTVRNNLIEGCSGVGLFAHSPSAGSAEFADNQLLACGIGIEVWDGAVLVKNNVILGSTFDAIRVGDGTVEGNVVGRSGGSGVVLTGGSEVTVQNNTSFGNGESGFEADSRGLTRLERNIAYGNHQYGLRVVSGSALPNLSCNDWFANDSGAVAGMSPSPQDMSVDPLFCDVDHDSVSLTANSPLLDAPGCGLIGARGLGCASTPTLITLFTAQRDPAGVRVRWVVDTTRLAEVWVERADVVAGPWVMIATEHSTEGGIRVALDRSASADRGYWYHLVGRDGREAVVISEPVSVSGSVSHRFELTRVTPNPGFGPLSVSFTLPHEATVELNVVDLQGRQVKSLVHGALLAGTHTVAWIEPSSPGIYFVDYRFPGGHQVERVVRLR